MLPKLEEVAPLVIPPATDDAKEAEKAEKDKTEEKKKVRSQASALLDMVQEQVYFHTADGKPFACVEVASHNETHGLRSEGFRDYLSHVYYAQTKSALNDRSIRDVIGALSSKAKFDGPCKSVWYRVAEHDEAIYIDLN